MGKYFVINVSGKKPRLMKTTTTRSSAQKYRTTYYKKHKRGNLWIVNKYSKTVGSHSY
jgi:hypothetical protein